MPTSDSLEAEMVRDYDRILLALCIWREARGESVTAKVGVGWTVRNRALRPSWWGRDWAGVITKKWQFTSMTGAGDPNLIVWPDRTDSTWLASLDAAYTVYAGTVDDPTGGATHYFDKSLDRNPPSWATAPNMHHTKDIGAFHFYRAG